jgi:phosphinothricin acetyltransferase
VEQEGEVIAFAATFAYSPRACYAGIAEVSLYVERGARGRGAGRLVMTELLRAAELGFREVGIYEKHGCLDGVWRDVVIIERLLPANLRT